MDKGLLKYTSLKAELRQARFLIRPLDPLMNNGSVSGCIGINVSCDGYFNSSELQSVKTPSGYYAFYNLKSRKYRFSIETSYYVNKRFEITYPVVISDSNDPIIVDEEIKVYRKNKIIIADVLLLPAPTYMFTCGSTLLRVAVNKKDSREPVAFANIYARFKNKSSTDTIFVSRADMYGQAVVCCNCMSKTEVIQMNGFIVNSPRKITIVARDPQSRRVAKKEIEIKEFSEIPVILEFTE